MSAWDERLPRPPEEEASRPGMWVHEAIYGHRFGGDQEPYMVVLEGLSICADHKLGSVKPVNGQHEQINCQKLYKEKLRFLLFQDHSIDRISRDESIANSDRWSRWKELANQHFGAAGAEENHDHFSYLDKSFNKDFRKLAQAVRILQSLELDPNNCRRWSSRFLPITGRSLILSDIQKKKSGGFTDDRRFFSRGGELLYLMLNRANLAENLGELIEKRIFSESDPIDRIASALLAPSDKDGTKSASIGYLPLAHHYVYDRLAEDWKGILEAPRLPSSHLFEPMVHVTALNLLCYFIGRSSSVLGRDPSLDVIVMDNQDGKDSHMLRIAKNNLQQHRKSINDAVSEFIDRELEGTDWEEAVRNEDSQHANRILRKTFFIKEKDKANPGVTRGPNAQKNAFIKAAQSRDQNNMYKQMMSLVKNGGLALARRGVGTWLSSSDALLQALVVSNVGKGGVEISEFLGRLYDRYGLVMGPAEARRAFKRLPCDVRSFENNVQALESRLTSMGLTTRLSDDCAFVENPFVEGEISGYG